MIKVNIYRIILFGVVFAITSCNNAKNTTHQHPKQHWIEIERPSIGVMYIDSVPLQTVMKVSELREASRNFKAYLIGFIDSVVNNDKEALINRNKYYQYDLQNNWEAVKGEEVFTPVFYQPRTSTNQHVNEGIMVFESEGENHPDTLIYTDTFGSWGKQKFILKEE